MKNSEKSGRPFERLVAAVQRKLDPAALVHSPFRVSGRSGASVSLDAAVCATVGSAEIVVAIEAKDYRDNVGVEKVRTFAALLQDIQASKGIMVGAAGFTRDALLTAEHFGIDTCVLRAAKEDDWSGRLRSFKATLVTTTEVLRDASIVLVDGRTIPVRKTALLKDKDGNTVYFDLIVNYAIHLQPDADGKNIIIKPVEPLWRDDGGTLVEVAELRCRREVIEGLTLSWLDRAPEDWIFVRHTSLGPVDESTFFEFAELAQIAEHFRDPAGTT